MKMSLESIPRWVRSRNPQTIYPQAAKKSSPETRPISSFFRFFSTTAARDRSQDKARTRRHTVRKRGKGLSPAIETFPPLLSLWMSGESVSVFHERFLTLPLSWTHHQPAFERKNKMKTETINVVRSILTADETVSNEKLESVLRNMRQTTAQHRHLIGARQAMEILGVSRPTLRAYVKQGFISQIGFSSRKVRFDEDEIRRFADNGAPSTISCPRPSSTGTTDAPKANLTKEMGFVF